MNLHTIPSHDAQLVCDYLEARWFGLHFRPDGDTILYIPGELHAPTGPDPVVHHSRASRAFASTLAHEWLAAGRPDNATMSHDYTQYRRLLEDWTDE